jgi:glucose-1-phosphate cytidylyltransferase
MKVVILAGGFGSRLSELTDHLPKPMVEIGNKPILWHIMKTYAHYGYNEFIIALGYKAEVIKEYFLNFYAFDHDISLDLSSGKFTIKHKEKTDWTVHLVNTGLDTQTGGRVLRLKEWIGNETFMLTYGDGVGNIRIDQLVEFHKNHGKFATVTASHPPSRFGAITYNENEVISFSEKNVTKGGWISSGFFVLEPEIFSLLKDDKTIWEKYPLETLADMHELMVFFHDGYWQPMDTLRERRILQKLWDSNNAPWKVWDNETANRGEHEKLLER